MKAKKVLTFIMLGLFLFCQKQSPFRELQGPLDKLENADAVIRNFLATGFQGAEQAYTLAGEEAYLFQQINVTRVYKVVIEYPEKGEKLPTIITANEALVDNPGRKTELRGDVTVKSPNGRTLECKDLVWDQSKQVLNTEAEVKIVMPSGDIIEGVGLSADQKLNRLVLKRGRGLHPM